jgi:F-type H+-transporting ATPase subunit a
MADPISQFQIKKLVPLGQVGGYEIAFTNSAAFMFGAVAVIVGGLLLVTAGRALVPGRAQSTAEVIYEFVADMIRQTAGEAGMRFFPLVFTLFSFILVLNMLGMVPGFFTVTSHIAVTAALALLVFFTVIVYGVWHNGVKFLRIFVPKGVPIYILPLVTLIEIISFLSRPLSHSVRLFANMLAGHITLKVFAGFIGLLATSLGVFGFVVGILPFGMTVALIALEFLVAFLQAYVFTMLTCIYLNDALHPGH